METPETLYERGYSVWKHQNIKLYTSEVTQYGNTRILNSIRARLLSMETPKLYTSEVTQYGNTRILNSIRARLLSMEY